MPGLLYDYLKQATEGKLVTRIDEQDLADLRRSDETGRRVLVKSISGGALFFSGAMMVGLEAGPWTLFGLSASGLVVLTVGAWLLFKAGR